jgi:hypothetical protein
LTSPGAAAQKDRWPRAVGYGLLAEVCTIVTIIAIVMLYRYVFAKGLSDTAYAAFGDRAGMIVGIVGGTIYTFLFARLLARNLADRQVAHGIVVAIAAIALSVGGSLAGHHGLPSGYLLASILKLSVGALAGLLGARSRPPLPA